MSGPATTDGGDMPILKASIRVKLKGGTYRINLESGKVSEISGGNRRDLEALMVAASPIATSAHYAAGISHALFVLMPALGAKIVSPLPPEIEKRLAEVGDE